MTAAASGKLIHLATLNSGAELLELREVEPNKRYGWLRQGASTDVEAPSISEAIRKGALKWKEEGFRPIRCGTLFTLPERDEHGQNALFYQLVESSKSPNGVFFDPTLGSLCMVRESSQQALSRLKSAK